MDPTAVDEACARVKGVLESWGFKLQDETLAESRCTSLGVLIDGESGVVSLPPAKLARLVAACEFMSRRPVVTSKQVQRILGHVTYACMLFRPLLAVISAAYAFTRKYGAIYKLFLGECHEVMYEFHSDPMGN